MNCDDGYCLHELPKGQCAYCKPLPREVMKRGYRTRFGQVFHNDPNCALMREGQRKAGRRGREPTEPTPIHWVDAQARGLGQCLGCCTPQWRARHDTLAKLTKPCWVNIDGTWRPGELIWLNRRADGLWWAYATYTHEGRRVTVAKSQHDLRIRDP